MKNILRIVLPCILLLTAAGATVTAWGQNPAPATSVEAAADTCTVVLVDFGPNKVKVIKIVKEYLGIGLKEAHDLVNAAPSVIKENVPMKEARELADKLTAAEAKVELKTKE
jgi:large subunit ribosomal protein L7/L12